MPENRETVAPVTEQLKRQAALEALNEVRSGMIVGLGTGSTASHFIRELGAKVREGLKINAIPTSEESSRVAREVGIPLTDFDQNLSIDITVDGADEVSRELDLIKGLGGALVREKIVAHASSRVLIVVDETKLVDQLGARVAIPVEVIPFAATLVRRHLEKRGGQAQARVRGGRLFVSDNGNTILDWQHGRVDDPAMLERELKTVTGVVDSGIFSDAVHSVIVAGASGVSRLNRGHH